MSKAARLAGVTRIPYLVDDLESLHRILEVKERAGFKFVVIEASLREVEAGGQAGDTRSVRDVEDTWLVRSEGVVHEPVDIERLGSVSSKDWLLRDAIGAFRC